MEQLQTIIQKECQIENAEEVVTMLNYYHALGVIVKHRNTVVLQAQWLIDILKQLITIRSFDNMEPRHCKSWRAMELTGALSLELVDHVFSKFSQEGQTREDILNMMEQFGLIVKFAPSPTCEMYFVPCQQRPPPEDLRKKEPSSSDPCSLYLRFLGGFVPHGLYSQLVSRCTRWCSKSGFKQPPKLYDRAAQFFIDKELIHQLILVCKKRSIKIILKEIKQEHEVLLAEAKVKEVTVMVRRFLENTMQNLTHELPWLKNFTYEFCVECPYCRTKENKSCPEHGKVSCTHEDCMCFLKFPPNGQLSYCRNSFCDEILTLPELEKWFTIRERDPEHEAPDPVTNIEYCSLEPHERDATTRQMTHDEETTPGHEAPVNNCEEDSTIGQKTHGELVFSDLQRMQCGARRGTNNTDLPQKWKIFSDKGFMISDNQGGGNCMFHALSEQLDLMKGIKISHQKLRHEVVNYLKNNPKLANGTELSNFVDGNSPWDSYLTNMAKDGTWGDHVILHGAANCFGTSIHVISSLSHNNDVIINPERDVASSNQLVLGHVCELHYVSLIPVKEGSPFDHELEGLARRIEDWKSLGRRLNFDEGMLNGFHKDNEKWCEKAYAMLIKWKEREGSTATYKVLFEALCHEYVNRRDLAEKICCSCKPKK